MEPNMNALPVAIQDFLNSAPYYPCLLLVHPRIERLRAAADALQESYGWPQLSIGPELSETLLLIEPKRRPRRVAKWLNDAQADI